MSFAKWQPVCLCCDLLNGACDMTAIPKAIPGAPHVVKSF